MGFVRVHLRISAFAGAALAATFAQTRTAARPKFASLPGKGQGESLVIDHIQRPSKN
jgi:hypothetical protein